MSGTCEKEEKYAHGSDKKSGETWRDKINTELGFDLSVLTSWTDLVTLLHKPVDPSSLALSRICFGLLMVCDIPEERGLSSADLRWGDPSQCRFPLFDFLPTLPFEWMCILYLVMWLAAVGVMLGAHYRLSCLLFSISYWYLFLLDKTAWNNHSYLYGLLSMLFLVTDSHHFWSVDSWLGRVKPNTDIPLWNYAIFRFQMFLLYFYAGLKKTEYDWITGHSMSSLSNHWVFHPMKTFLTLEQIDLWVIHVFGFLLDLTVGFWIYFDKTRPISFFFLTSFHLMNSQMFHIGMFPYVCLATMPLFCSFDWPKKLCLKYEKLKYCAIFDSVKNPSCVYSNKKTEGRPVISLKQMCTVLLLMCHVAIQLFLPYSHFITKGYNNWTNGLYGYSWDMMVHTWDTVLIIVKIRDRQTGQIIYLDPEAWVQNNRWHKHADMVMQYAKCVARNLERTQHMNNISVNIDVWSSLNGRFQQRMFDPRVDLLAAEWSPFITVPWLLPLLSQFSGWRGRLDAIHQEVKSWSNHSDVLFIADFPGLSLENYIHKDLSNITLAVLEGEISLSFAENQTGPSQILKCGESVSIPPATLHHLKTISRTPSSYMYTYYNMSKFGQLYPTSDTILELVQNRIDNVLRSIALVSNAFLNVLYSVPMVRRVPITDHALLK